MLSPLAEPKGEGVSSTEVLWALPRPDGALQDQPGPESGLAAALAPLPMESVTQFCLDKPRSLRD